MDWLQDKKEFVKKFLSKKEALWARRAEKFERKKIDICTAGFEPAW